jgi:hypothetical protein
VVNTDAESELFRGGHLVGGRRIRPRFSLLAGNGPPGETIRFESSAVAHLLGGRAWQWLGQVSGSLRAGEPTDLEFPESDIPPGIYRVDLDVRFGNNNP